MSSNATLVEVKDHGWLNGFMPLWHKGNHGWWGSRSWLVKILVWIMIIDGLLAMVAFATPQVEDAGSGQAVNTVEASEPGGSVLMVYFIFAAMVPAMGVIIFGHETIIDERKMGTAAWVLSKPVSRASFLLAKLAVDALGVLGTTVLVQGVIAFFIIKTSTDIKLSIPGFIAGLGLVYLFLLFYLTLTQMLGTLFHSRGPVIGIPLVLISSGYLAVLAPWLGNFMPSSLILSLGAGQISLAEALVQGQPLPTVLPIISTGLLSILFIIVALLRFEREEF